jgi:hypothetical protein
VALEFLDSIYFGKADSDTQDALGKTPERPAVAALDKRQEKGSKPPFGIDPWLWIRVWTERLTMGFLYEGPPDLGPRIRVPSAGPSTTPNGTRLRPRCAAARGCLSRPQPPGREG